MIKFLNPYFLPLLLIVFVKLYFYLKSDKNSDSNLSFSNFISKIIVKHIPSATPPGYHLGARGADMIQE